MLWIDFWELKFNDQIHSRKPASDCIDDKIVEAIRCLFLFDLMVKLYNIFLFLFFIFYHSLLKRHCIFEQNKISVVALRMWESINKVSV